MKRPFGIQTNDTKREILDIVFGYNWRRRRDSNPRAGTPDLLP